MDSNEKWYSVKEFSALFGWSGDTVRRLVNRGFIRAIVLPQQSARRRRNYRSLRIHSSEAQRLEQRLLVRAGVATSRPRL